MNYSVQYLEKFKAVLLKWTGYEAGVSYSKGISEAIALIEEKKAQALVVDRTFDMTVESEDRKWFVKTGLNKLTKSGIKNVVFIVPEDLVSQKNNLYPFAEVSDRIKINKIASIENLGSVLKAEVVASDEVKAFTKADALKYMGLPNNANDYIIDEKFWTLSKQYRDLEDSEQKLADLSEVYDIATGRRDERVKRSEIREQSKKFLGKTSDEWSNHIHYSWYKYLIAIVLILAIGNLCYHMFIKPRPDCGVISVGHFVVDDDTILEGHLNNLGYENPYMNLVDVVVLNDQGEVESAYEDNSTATLFLSQPNVVITDEMTLPYYYSYFMDISEIYAQARIELTDEQLRYVHPIYCSERDYYSLMREYDLAKYDSTEINDLSSYSTQPVLIGIMVDSEAWIETLGYYTSWPDSEPNLVLSAYYDSSDYSKSEDIILGLLKLIRG